VYYNTSTLIYQFQLFLNDLVLFLRPAVLYTAVKEAQEEMRYSSRSELRCPDCGNNKMGQGKISGYATLTPVGKFFSLGSAIIADVCTNCGTIVRMKAEKPEKFKSDRI